MGKVKQMWQDRQDEIIEKYRLGDLAYPDAIYALTRLGFDPHEAKNLLEMSLS